MKWWLSRSVLGLVGATALFRCGDGTRRPPEPAGTASGTSADGGSDGAGTNAGSAGAAGTTTAKNWPPPHLLYFLGYGIGLQAAGVRVDDRSVYVALSGGRIQRAPSDGSGQLESFFTCPTCDPNDFTNDGEYLYFLARSELIRVHRDTRQELRIELPFDHLGRGGLLVSDSYVYTAMPGCASITRIDKQTQAVETMYREGAVYPGAGVTELAEHGAGLICGTPSEILAIDEWEAAPRVLYSEVQQLWGLRVLETQAFWLEQGPNDSAAALGKISLTDGAAELVARATSGGHTPRLLAWDSKLVYGNNSGLWAFDTETQAPAGSVEVGHVNDLAIDGAAVYGTIWGQRALEGGGADFAFWIVRVPFGAWP